MIVCTAGVPLYADDTIIYSTGFTLNKDGEKLQSAFQQPQAILRGLKLVLNVSASTFYKNFQKSFTDLR